MKAVAEQVEAIRAVLNAMPHAILVVDRDMCVLDHNEAAKALLAAPASADRHERAGHAIRCINAAATNEGCGHSAQCPKCGLRNALNSAVRAERRVRSRATLRVARAGGVEDQHFRVTVAPFAQLGEMRWLIVLEDCNDVAELEKLLPVCPSCKAVRSDESLRNGVEAYLRKHWDADLTACLCSDCRARLYGETTETRA